MALSALGAKPLAQRSPLSLQKILLLLELLCFAPLRGDSKLQRRGRGGNITAFLFSSNAYRVSVSLPVWLPAEAFGDNFLDALFTGFWE